MGESVQDNPFVALDELTELISFDAVGFESLDRLLRVFRRDHRDHADAHVKGVEHIVLGDVPGLLDQVKDREDLDVRRRDLRRQALFQRPRDVLVEAAAGDMGDRFDLHRLEEGEHRLHIDAGRG